LLPHGFASKWFWQNRLPYGLINPFYQFNQMTFFCSSILGLRKQSYNILRQDQHTEL